MTGLHKWERKRPSEPMTCAICGCYYASAAGIASCTGPREQAVADALPSDAAASLGDRGDPGLPPAQEDPEKLERVEAVNVWDPGDGGPIFKPPLPWNLAISPRLAPRDPSVAEDPQARTRSI